MYAGVGAISTPTRDALLAALPTCYSPRFDSCMVDESKRATRQCQRYEPVHLAYDQDFEAADAIVEALPLCPYTGRQLGLAVVSAFLGGAIMAAIVI